MLFNTIEQEFCTTSETKRTNCWVPLYWQKEDRTKAAIATDATTQHTNDTEYIQYRILSVFSPLSNCKSPLGKVPSPVAIKHQSHSHRPEPHGAWAGRWLHPKKLTEQQAAPSLPIRYWLCFSSNSITGTALQLFPSTFQPEASRHFRNVKTHGIAVESPFPPFPLVSRERKWLMRGYTARQRQRQQS